MITYPNVKLNLGLRILRKRPDGYHDIDTLFFPCDIDYSCVSSSMVRDVAAYGGEVRDFVPDSIAEKLYLKLEEKGLIRIPKSDK